MIWRLLWTALLLAAAVIDGRGQRIPNWLTYGGMALGLLAAAAGGRAALLAALAGAAAALLFFGLAYALGRLWPGGAALGLGDVKLAVWIGVICGWPLAGPALFLGLLAGGLAALVSILGRLLRGRYRPGAAMAYGPYLALGGAAALWVQPWLLRLWGMVWGG